jgi:hypothetical protein
MATYIKPSDPRYKKLTPAQRNANTLLNLKNSFKPAPAKKPQTAKSTSKVVESLTSGFSRNMRALGTPVRTAAPPAKVPAKKPTAPAAKPTPTKAPAKTVSQIWKEKTGKDWSEAKKLGLSDGSASSNMALLKKLNSGEITDAVLNPTKPKEETKPATVPTREEAIEAGESLVRMRRGGVKGKPVLKKKIIKKPVMRRGGIKKK